MPFSCLNAVFVFERNFLVLKAQLLPLRVAMSSALALPLPDAARALQQGPAKRVLPRGQRRGTRRHVVICAVTVWRP